VPLLTFRVPELFRTEELANVAVDEPAVTLSVPVLLNVLAPLKNRPLLILKLAELFTTASPLVLILPVPDQLTAPPLLSTWPPVRPLSFAEEMLSAAPAGIVRVPLPSRLPPVQVNVPGTVTTPVPLSVPKLMVRFAIETSALIVRVPWLSR